MTLRILLALLVVVVGCTPDDLVDPDLAAYDGVGQLGAAPPKSVLLIVADDLGWGDVGVQGGRIPTPALDALAAEGTRFTAAYASAPVCSPSRAGIMTGRQQNRFGFEFNAGPPTLAELEGRGLPDTEVTMAEILGAAGLRTALLGKWHLGVTASQRPEVRGFDDTWSFLSGQRWSLEPGQPDVLDAWPFPDVPEPVWPEGHWSEAIYDDGVRVDPDPERHLTDVLADRAVDWLGQVGTDPFLLVVTFNAAHEPFQATQEHLDRIAGLGLTDPLQRVYAATVAELDVAVGRILDELDASGRADDTVVVFVSDHGCVDVWGACSNGGWSGGKLRLSEGGLRVPLLVRWPGAPAGGVVRAPVSTLDLLPTLARAARARLPDDRDYDGVDLVPFLAGKAPAPHPRLAWRMGDARAVRDGQMKLVEAYGHTWLFDLAADPGETTNLADLRPRTVARLHRLLDTREADYEDPAWSGRSGQVDYYDQPDVTVEF